MPAMDLSKNEFQHGHPPALSSLGLGSESLIKSYPRLERLRERIAGQHAIAPAQVLLQPGGASALAMLFLAYAAIARGGTAQVLLPSMTWQYYEELAARFALPLRRFPLLRGQNRYMFDIEALTGELEEARGALLMLPLPNNPTGVGMSPDQLDRVCRAVPDDSLIVIDECYHGFGPRNLAPAEFLVAYPQAIILRSFSKFYGLAGVRIAYLLAGDEARRRLRLEQPYLGSSCLAERMAMFCLDNHDYYTHTARQVIEERGRFTAFLNATGFCHCFESDANFVLLAMPGRAARYVDFLRRHDIHVRLYATAPLEDHVRITVGTPAQMARLRDLTQQFADALAAERCPPEIPERS